MTGPRPAERLAPLPGTAPCGGCRAPRHATVGRVPCPGCGTIRWTLAVAVSPPLVVRPDQVLTAARTGLLELRDRMGGRPGLVLHGDAAGADRLLPHRLLQAGWTIEAVPADWDRHGRRAGVLRDLSMLGRADALLVIWNGVSAATRTTIDLAARRHLPIACQIIPDNPRPAPPGGGDGKAAPTLAAGRAGS